MNRQIRPIVAGLGLFTVTLVCPGLACAQQSDQQPTPPVQPVQPVGDDANASKNTPQQPANNPTPTPPLLAATDLTFALPVERSYLAPSLSYYGQLNSNAFTHQRHGANRISRIQGSPASSPPNVVHQNCVKPLK